MSISLNALNVVWLIEINERSAEVREQYQTARKVIIIIIIIIIMIS